jgi:UDP-glucuronate 4-epimerase
MAPMLFARAILAGEPIRVFNQGRMHRDFTYIDDIVEGVIRCLDKPASADPGFDAALPNPATSWAPHHLFNIGNSKPEELLHFITQLEKALGRTAIKHLEPTQPGVLVDQLRAGTSRQELKLDFPQLSQPALIYAEIQAGLPKPTGGHRKSLKLQRA